MAKVTAPTDEPVWVREGEGPRWTGRLSLRYGLLCCAQDEWYVKDRLRAQLLQTPALRHLITAWPAEAAMGGRTGLALEGRRFADRAAAARARDALQRLEEETGQGWDEPDEDPGCGDLGGGGR